MSLDCGQWLSESTRAYLLSAEEADADGEEEEEFDDAPQAPPQLPAYTRGYARDSPPTPLRVEPREGIDRSRIMEYICSGSFGSEMFADLANNSSAALCLLQTVTNRTDQARAPALSHPTV